MLEIPQISNLIESMQTFVTSYFQNQIWQRSCRVCTNFWHNLVKSIIQRNWIPHFRWERHVP